MREIQISQIIDLTCELFLKANVHIGPDVMDALREAEAGEPSELGRSVLADIIANNELGAAQNACVCQDTGTCVVFLTLGQDVHIVGGALEDAVNAGVRRAYETGYFRKSVVADPLFDRKNTGDNTPCVLHIRVVPGETFHMLAIAKGFGSENMSQLKMLTPADGVEGVKRFVLQTVEEAGPNPCPPLVVGVGLGGTFELCALMAKRATALPLTRSHKDPRYAALENELRDDINKLGIGPAGYGGRTTALKVHIVTAPTHIAGLPVAVNICCHVARHAEGTL